MKVVLWDTASGDTASARSEPYVLDSPAPGRWEQDPAVWLTGLLQAVSSLRGALPAPLGVDALALSGQMHGLVAAAADGRPLRPAMLWPDQRATAEARELEAEVGREPLAALTGSPASANYVLPKLLWLRRHEPATLDRAGHILAPKDWVRLALGAEPLTDPTDGSGTGLMRLDRLAWAEELLLGLPRRLLPPLVPSASVTGRLSAAWAGRLGLREGTPLITGAGDLPAAVLAAGARDAGRPVLNLGSAGQVALVRPSGAALAPGAQLFCHPNPALRIELGALLAAGLAVAWARERLGGAAPAPPAEVPDLLFIPHLAGERMPSFDLRLRGAWVGLGLDTDAPAMAGAAAYGVAMAYRELLEGFGVQGRRPVVLVEGAFAADWAQRLANTLGRDLDLCTEPSPSALGACRLAAVALGERRWNTLEAPVSRPVAHDPRAAARLETLYAAYRTLRPHLAGAAARLSRE